MSTESLKALAEYHADQLAPVIDVEIKRMFSGWGLCVDGVQFAMAVRDDFYMRVDDDTRPLYEEAGSTPFTYETNGRSKPVVVRRYFTLPAEAAENAERFGELALEALDAARRDDVTRRAKKAKKESSK
jgi:DNA transformation protein